MGPVYEDISKHIQELPRSSFYHTNYLGLVQALCYFDTFGVCLGPVYEDIGTLRGYQDLLSIAQTVLNWFKHYVLLTLLRHVWSMFMRILVGTFRSFQDLLSIIFIGKLIWLMQHQKKISNILLIRAKAQNG